MKSIFGYHKGQKIDTPAEGHTKDGLSYITVDHKAFDEGVVVYFTEKTGVCKLMGFDEVTNPDKYGIEHRNAYERFRDRVAAKYGEYKEYDFLCSSSIWDEPDDWLMSLRKKERTLAAIWIVENGSTLPDGLEGIVVEAGELFIKVTYELDNLDESIAVGETIQSEDF